jgi:addiction module antidote protein, HigA family
MSIKLEDIDSVDLSDVVVPGVRIAPINPGEILEEEFLAPLAISQNQLAKATRLKSRVNKIVRGERGISTDTAIRLGIFFGTTPEFRLNLQAAHDLETAMQDPELVSDCGEILPYAATA